MQELDKKDREILFHLSLDARATLGQLSKKTRLSKEVVHYRLKRLEERGIVEGYYGVINTYKLGRIFYRVYMKTINMTNEQEQEFLEYLKQHPKVTWIVELDGDLNFLYVVWGKNIHDFQQVWGEVNDRFGNFIQQKYFSVMTSVYYFKTKYLTKTEHDAFLLTGGEVITPKLDELDFKLIVLLSNEGRLSLVDLGKRLGTDAKNIQRRKKKLEEAGIITGYNVKINHKKLGLTQRKVMLNLNDNSREAIQRLTHFITRHPLTLYITIAIGQYDFEFEMMEENHEDFHKMLKELKETFPGLINDYFTVIFYDEPKVGQLAE